MSELQVEAELRQVSRGTIHKVLHQLGISSYVEEKKFILSAENMKRRLVSPGLRPGPGLGFEPTMALAFLDTVMVTAR